MKTIIAGSRDIVDYNLLEQAIDKIDWNITEVVSGHARGVDTLGEQYAQQHNLKLKIFPAQWDEYGKGAGFLRNTQMAQYAQALLAITNGSKGTAHMIRTAKIHDLKIKALFLVNNNTLLEM